MTKYISQVVFSRGELSPKVHERYDTEHYRLGLFFARNFITTRHGPMMRRAPTEFIYSVKDKAKPANTIEFDFGAEQAYQLEFGDYYMRVYKDGGIVLDGGNPVEITTPFNWLEARELDFTQSNDVLYLAHKNHHPQRLTRTSHEDWSLDLVQFADGPYGAKNGSGTKALPATDIIANQTINVSFDRADGINDGAGFSADDVGRYLRYEHPGKNDDLGYTAPTTGQHVAWGQITAVIDPITISVLWLGTAGIESLSGVTLINNVAESENWWLGAFYKPNTYPSSVGFMGDRLCWSRSNEYPGTTWKSKTGGYENYSPTDKDGAVADDHAMTSTISAGQVNEIQWIAEGNNKLLIGTKSALRSIGSADGEPLSPDNRIQRLQSTFGSDKVKPAQVGNATLYVEYGGKALREAVYDFQTDGIVTPDASILSDHLHAGKIRDLAYTQSPHSIVWAHTEDGSLLSLTYERDQRTVGWMKHDINGYVEAISSIPGDGYSELWLLVKREINGVEERYVERMFDTFSALEQNLEDYAHLDCQAKYEGVATSTLSGLDHLEGVECGVVADGIYLGNVTIENGELTLPLDRSATKVIVGIPYVSEFVSMPPHWEDREGTSMMRKKKVDKLCLSLMEIVDIEVGSYDVGEDSFERLLGDEFSDDKQEKPELFTGLKTAGIRGSWEGRGQIMGRINNPYPGIVRGFEGRYEFAP